MPHTILLADQDPDLRGARTTVLHNAGFQFIEAATGTDAVRLACEKQPTVVVLAIALPDMDGFAVCRRLKGAPPTASIPVLHLSSHAGKYRYYPESLESGGDAYLEEPVEPAILVAVVTALIRARKPERDVLLKDQLSALIESIPDEVWFADPQGRLVLVNPAGLAEFRMEATTRTDVKALARSMEVYRADGSPRPIEEAPLLLALRGERVRNQESIVRTPIHGGFRYRQVSASPVRDAAGNIVGSVSVARDVTDQRRAEQEKQRLASELADRVGELQAILDTAPVAIWIAHDPQCQRITGNAYADQIVMQIARGGNVSLSAFPANAAVSYRTLRNGVEVPQQELPAQVAAATGQHVQDEEWALVFPDGRTVHMLLSAAPILDAGGRVRGSVTAGVDVTRRTRAEEALRESEAVLRSFFDSPGMMRGIVEIIDGGIVHVSCNAAAAAMFGVGESITGKSAADAGASEQVARQWVDLYDESRRTGKPASMEYARRDADGQERWLLATASSLGNGPSGCPRFGYVILDLTDHKRAEEVVRSAHDRISYILDTMSDCFVTFDRDWRYIHVNAAAAKAFHMRPEQLLGKTIWELWPAAYDLPLGVNFRRSLQENVAIQFEQFYPEPLNRWFECRCHPSGEGLAIFFSDISERKRAEAALRESEDRFRAMADNIPQLAWMANAEGSIFWYNRRWYDYTGATPKEMEGWGWQSVHHPEVLPKVLERWKASIVTGESFDMVFPLRGADGLFRPFLTRIMPVRDRDGKVSRWFGTNTDIGEQLKTEDALRRSNQDLEQFAYAASHDLQEPLRMVSIYTEMLARRYRGQIDEQADQFIEWTVAGARRMESLLRGLLEYSRIGSEFDCVSTIDSESALTTALENLQAAVEASGAVITYDSLPRVRLPETHLTQLFQNLIGNAIRYRSALAPRIHISVTQEGNWQRFAIEDNGIGIDPLYSEYIFKIFKRLDAASSSGTGIGLAICKRIVERWGGRIGVESALGKGATFYFTLPPM